jgi:hypothetical protein
MAGARRTERDGHTEPVIGQDPGVDAAILFPGQREAVLRQAGDRG